MTMKIALIGASGNVGSRIAAELSSRGHKITAIARGTSKITSRWGVSATAADSAGTDALVIIGKGHDAVISSVPFTASNPDQLIGAVKASGVPRYLVLGGAGSLRVAPGKLLVDPMTNLSHSIRVGQLEIHAEEVGEDSPALVFIHYWGGSLRGADRVALGRCRPRAPTDPYVPALGHTVPQIMGSLRVCKPNARCARLSAGNAGACGGNRSSSLSDCGCGEKATSASDAQLPTGTSSRPPNCL